MEREIVKLDEESRENWETLVYRKSAEGFHYCFEDYSDWEEIPDVKFHKLRKKYLKMAKKLNKYILKVARENDIPIDI